MLGRPSEELRHRSDAETAAGAAGCRVETAASTDGQQGLDEKDAATTFTQAVIASAADGIAVCHACEEFPHVRFTLWNAAMRRLTGYAMEAINERGWHQTLYPDPDESRRAAVRMKRMWDGDHLQDEEGTITRIDGATRVIAVTTSRLPVTKGVAEVVAIMRDITDRRRADEENRVRRQREASVGRIAAAVAHEVNNPLGTIKFWLRSFRKKAAGIPDIGEEISLIETQVDRISRSVRNLLGFVRPRGGHSDIVPAQILILNIADLYRGSLEETGIELTVQMEEELPGVAGRVDDLQEIIINLLENAKNILGDGNKVRIKANADEEALSILVSNDGPNLGDHPERIFEEFYTTRRAGTGIGLFHARSLCQLHGGALTAVNRREGGVEFRVSLPIRAESGLVALKENA